MEYTLNLIRSCSNCSLFVYVCFKRKLKTNHKTNYKLYCIGSTHTHKLNITSQTMNMHVYVVVVYKGAREDPCTGCIDCFNKVLSLHSFTHPD